MWKTLLALTGLFLTAAPAFGNGPETSDHATVESISQSQFISDQRALFDKADRNFDGTLSENELENVKIQATRENELKTFHSLDTDFSGYLSKEELLAGPKEFENYPAQSAERLKKSFLEVHDFDRNGTISSHEIKQFYDNYAETLSQKIRKNTESKFKLMDRDRTGVISKEEFLTPLKKADRDKVDRKESSVNYISRDKNADGIIARSENMDFIKSVFTVLDANGDAELSPMEQNIILYDDIQLVEADRIYIGPDAGVLKPCEILCSKR